MYRRVITVASIALMGGIGLVGCAQDPCPTLPPPSPAQIEASQVAEVEREVGSYECVVQDGRWVWSND